MANSSRDRLGGLIGASPVMQAVYERIEKAGNSNATVLLTGASGTGKELAARAIHDCSGRRRGPFIPVNTGAIPRDLTAAELFGAEIGAFTGAVVQRKGKFELAHGGTLFLDEIAATDQMTQVTLLRALEERSITRLGGRHSIPISVRFIAATNENLSGAIREGRFREDLFFRLDIFQIRMPLLKDRGEDVLLLAETFLEHLAREAGQDGMELDDEARQCITEYGWPGNVRELKNSIQRAVVAADGDVVGRKDFAPRLRHAIAVTKEVRFRIGRNLAEVERAYVMETLAHCGGNKKETARILGISRKSLYDKLGRWENESTSHEVYGATGDEVSPPPPNRTAEEE